MVRISYIDEIDEKILKILEENARTPYTKIAEIVNLSEAGVRKRIRKLEERGIIKRYTIEINYKILGYKVSWIGIDVKPEKMVRVIDEVKNMNGNVKSIYTSTGDHDIMIEFVYKTQEELNNFVRDLERIEGITRICPAILVEKL